MHTQDSVALAVREKKGVAVVKSKSRDPIQTPYDLLCIVFAGALRPLYACEISVFLLQPFPRYEGVPKFNSRPRDRAPEPL